MDRLTEEVSNQPLGQKWVQLFNRLGLEPRKRFSITVEHKDKKGEEKIRHCILDTIALWRGSETVAGKSEREMMKQLLTALKQVQGFEIIAIRLSETYGEYKYNLTCVYKYTPRSFYLAQYLGILTV